MVYDPAGMYPVGYDPHGMHGVPYTDPTNMYYPHATPNPAEV